MSHHTEELQTSKEYSDSMNLRGILKFSQEFSQWHRENKQRASAFKIHLFIIISTACSY